MTEKTSLLQVEHLKKYYPVPGRGGHAVHAVDDVSFSIQKGETLGLVGESGCGKSTIGRQIAGLETPTAGRILYAGRDLAALSHSEKKAMRPDVQMVFQDSYSALNPRKRVYDILSEPMRFHHLAEGAALQARVEELLETVGLPRAAKNRYPHEFSGGQRQRIGIARALCLSPKLIVLDEPVSALDVSVQAQILNLLKKLQAENGLSYLFIGHGLAAVHAIAQRVAVMYLGQLVETGTAEEIFLHPQHPYTRALVAAAPQPDPNVCMPPLPLSGEVGSAIDPAPGCRFAPRCPYATADCRAAAPALVPISGNNAHFVACKAISNEKEH